MSLWQNVKLEDTAGVLSFTVNQDCSCIAVASLHGVRIFNVEQARTLFNEDIGAVRTVEMLYRTSLLAYVGAGEQPHLSPRKLIFMNTQTMSVIKTIMFQTSILAVKLNRKRLIVVLETETVVYELEKLQKLRVLTTSMNPKGVCALSVTEWPSYVALPSSDENGALRLYDTLTEGGNLMIEIDAHKSPLVAAAFNDDTSMLATASEKGTLIHVFSLPDGEKLHTLRRGSVRASILSLAFTPEECNPRLLSVVGSHGTVHVFKLVSTHLSKSVLSHAASAAMVMLSAVTPFPLDTIVAERSRISISYPETSFHTSFFSPLTFEHREDGIRTTSDRATLYIISSQGKLFQYTLSGLLSDECRASRTAEYRILSSDAMD